MKTAAIISLKGGTGKTTTSLALSYLLAEHHQKRVLYLENDKQGNAARTLKVYDQNKKTGTGNILLGQNIRENIQKTDYAKIDISPCNMFMKMAEATLMRDNAAVQYDRYAKALEEIDQEYDYCIIDNPPDIGINVINAIVAAGLIIILVNADEYSLDGLEELTEQINQLKTLSQWEKTVKCMITNFEKSDTSVAAEQWLNHNSGQNMYSTKIRHTKKAKDSTFYHKPLPEYSIRCAAAQDYKTVAKEIINDLAEERRKRHGI